MIKCCKNCEKRFTACHDSCKQYKEEKEEDYKRKKWLNRQNSIISQRNFYVNLIHGDGTVRQLIKSSYYH